MIPGQRLLKRFLLAFIVCGAILAGILYGVRFLGAPVASPTPDPLASVQPIEIISQTLLFVQDHDYDVLLRVRNPNQTYGSGNVQYTLSAAGATIYTGSFYILPGQTKYVVVTPIRSDRTLSGIDAHITSVDWQELDTLASQGVNFVVTSTSYSKVPQDRIFGRMRGFVANNSDFDINRVDVAVVLFDEKDQPIAVNRTEIHTFLSHTTRGFEASWFSPFTGTVARTYVEAQANLFEQSSFVRTYGGKELFQSY